MKKPFKDTKLGQFLAVKAPHILAKVGNFLPDSGILGLVKQLVLADPDIKPEDRLAYEKLQIDFELEMYRVEAADRASARIRETEYVKATGHIDWMMVFVGVVGLGAFLFMLYVVVYEDITGPRETLVVHTMGIIEGVVLSIFGYYYGSSKGQERGRAATQGR